jgi:hypothetical protein
MHSALIQILRVNEPRSGVKDGREWKMQDAECVLLDDKGDMLQVGVLMIPKEIHGQVKPGRFSAGFTLMPNLATRRIEARIVSLQALPDMKRPG